MTRDHLGLRDVGRIEKGDLLDLAGSALLRPIQLHPLGVVFMLSTEKRNRTPFMLVGQTNEKTSKTLTRARLGITAHRLITTRAVYLHSNGHNSD